MEEVTAGRCEAFKPEVNENKIRRYCAQQAASSSSVITGFIASMCDFSPALAGRLHLDCTQTLGFSRQAAKGASPVSHARDLAPPKSLLPLAGMAPPAESLQTAGCVPPPRPVDRFIIPPRPRCLCRRKSNAEVNAELKDHLETAVADQALILLMMADQHFVSCGTLPPLVIALLTTTFPSAHLDHRPPLSDGMLPPDHRCSPQ